ncbi:AAA domain-containing protein [Chitinophaga sp. sic0106]|uniref:AAA domain-containing protein n=1 Tax=Chitinophaga sp. sic0106 TaxID=2854785 RepID=UPI001C43C54C|nr:AAA domain-containing protein [Chitinophaga sp. sic0106]MBV7529832.1 hypothetical protein [Chitinophaga sp. sic0106]
MTIKENYQLLRYWRNTLADASRAVVEVSKVKHQYDAQINFETGQVNKQQAATLLDQIEEKKNHAVGRKNVNDPDWEILEEASIMIAPFSVNPTPEYTKYSGEKGTSYPFWIKAILDRSGRLKPDDDTFPYIPRQHLEPQTNNHVNFIFSSVDKIDKTFATPFAADGGWNAYWHYIQTAFKRITDIPLESYAIETHTVSFSNVMVEFDMLVGAADGIIKLYDYLLREKELPPLLKNITNKHYEAIKSLLAPADFEMQSAQHLGQMAFSYPLSISQRKALYHFQTLQEGESLAVNGPPGTGKTTLLQSIVANQVVQGAIRGGNPAVIVACSSNNQAVTNIIDSFLHVPQKAGLLYERWLPDVHGFGLYLPAQSKIVTGGIPYIKRNGSKYDGAHVEKENHRYITEAERNFQNQFEKYFNPQGYSLAKATDFIRQQLIYIQAQLQEGIELWQDYKAIPALLQQLGVVPATYLLDDAGLKMHALEKLKAEMVGLENTVLTYFDKESIWTKLFSFLPAIKEKRAARLRQIFREASFNTDTVNFYRQKEVMGFLERQFRLLKHVQHIHQQWDDWKQMYQIVYNPPLDDEGFRLAESQQRSYFYDELEMGLKYDLFYLAIHYWEGRWLLATKEAVWEERTRRNGRTDAENRWYRFAMLTPCFVSTFFMTPKFFSYSKHVSGKGPDSVWENPPLTAFIDLLIVDEAGQVAPEVGVATFGLAKKAIVVGDTLQIEPVWNVPKKVDVANLYRFNVINHPDNHAELSTLHTKGFLSSSGSMMKLAQKTSCYHLFPHMERGMMLTEHRRCYNEIIEYCNRLAYDGLLEPKKGPATTLPFAPMQYQHSKGNSRQIGTSRDNPEEAAAIAQWIKEQASQLLLYYQQVENKAATKENRVPKSVGLQDIIGIITPFSSQKHQLTSTLQGAGINIAGLTIGTVHALQGAERPVILFSATYGINDLESGYFYDAGVNMLNVAVSRAKDSFVLFGCKEVLRKSAQTPSGKLYHYIDSL